MEEGSGKGRRAYVVEEDVYGEFHLRVEVFDPEPNAIALSVRGEPLEMRGRAHLPVRSVAVVEALLVEPHELDLQLRHTQAREPSRSAARSLREQRTAQSQSAMPKPMFQGVGFLSTSASKYQKGSAPAWKD